MKKLLIILIIVFVVTFLLFATNNTDLEADRTAIKQAALDYIEGWYEGNAERMEKALHTDLTKRGVQILPQTQKTLLSFANASKR